MEEEQSQKPEDILKNILDELRNEDAEVRLNAVRKLYSLNYSSQAIRNELEKMAANDEDEDVRNAALAALNLPSNRNVQIRFNKLDRNNRQAILGEIATWEKSGLLKKQNADVLRRRYDFDVTTAAKTEPSTVTPVTPIAETSATSIDIPQKPQEPTAPRATLVQTLLSETSIKIALYLGAFFVISSAAILAALVEAARLPVLMISTLIFGGLSIAIKKRLPQPSFALFIVFSFLLPITANVVEDSLNLSTEFSIALYWIFISIFMAVIWGGGTWLYESRVFSILSFISITTAFYRFGDLFDAEPEFYATMTGLAALAGLAGVWLVKKWKDSNFALPLFITAQILQAVILFASLSISSFRLFDSTEVPLWHLAQIFTWGGAFIFYALSDLLFPFILFSWLAAGTLIPIPWFITAAFDMESIGAMITSAIWGTAISIASEVTNRFESIKKFSLPLFLVSIPSFGMALISGFTDSTTMGFVIAVGITCVYTALHLIRPRGWLWALALFNFIIAYFAFFELPFIENINIFFGYQLLIISLLFLLPDLLLKADFTANRNWRIPPRIYGWLFTALTISIYMPAEEEPLINTAIIFGIYAFFFAIYALKYQRAYIGYVSTFTLSVSVLYFLNHFNFDLWLPVLTGLAVLFYLAGVLLFSNRSWSNMLRYSGLALGTILILVALFTSKETGGWYALVIGALFAFEMYLSRNGWFELGLPILFNIGTFLILDDFNIEESSYRFLAYSLVWLLSDVISHLAFKNPRPLKWFVRGIGAFITVISYWILFFESDSQMAAFGFAVYALLFLTVSLLYRQPNLLYTFTLTLPLFVTFLFRSFDITKWIHPVIFIAMIYYGAGFLLRLIKRATGWDTSLLFSGLGLGVFVSLASPILGRLDAAIPVALAATLWAVEAFARKNVWLGFPTNLLYLLAYFIILSELQVDEPQFFSMGAALLGMIQHYLLVRADNKTGAFITGMVSQFILLGTTYIQMISTEELVYFFILFFQSIAVIVYGVIIRSRSLTFIPIGFVVLGVLTVVYSTLKEVNTVVVIGCMGILLLIFGIVAVLMRERITKFGERLSEWKA